MNHSLLTLNQNNFKPPVNAAAARSTLDADLCVFALTPKLFSQKKKKNNITPENSFLMSATLQSDEEVCSD